VSKINELTLRTIIMSDILITKDEPTINIGPGLAKLELALPTSHLKISIDRKMNFLKQFKGIKNLHLINATAEKLPFRDCTIPTITTQSTFQVMKDQKKFLKELFRTLKHNGTFIVTIEYGGTYDIESQQFKISPNKENNELENLIKYFFHLGLNILEVKYLNLNGKWCNNIEEGFSLWIFGDKR